MMATIQVKIVDVSGQISHTETSLNVPLKTDSIQEIEDVPTTVENEVTIQTSIVLEDTSEQEKDTTDSKFMKHSLKHGEDANTIPCKDITTPFDDLHGQIASGNVSWQSLSKDWKSTHVFTGKNTLFPAEMFIAVMEQKYSFTDDRSNLVADTLNRIPDPEQNSLAVLNMPSTLWKHQNMSFLIKLDWEGFKTELLKKFGQKEKYSSNQRALFLQSIQRGQRERMDTFLVRISTIVNIIQYGQANVGGQNEFQGQDAWVKILLLAGIDDESRSLMPENIEMLSSMAICNWLAKKNEKLYFEGIYGHDYSAIEYDNFFAKQALGWNDEEFSYMEEDTWLEDGENQNKNLDQLKTVHEDWRSEDEHDESNVRQSTRLRLKRKSKNSKTTISGRETKIRRTCIEAKTEEELEDSKKRAMETNKFSCDKCGEIFDSVSNNIYHIMILFNRFRYNLYHMDLIMNVQLILESI